MPSRPSSPIAGARSRVGSVPSLVPLLDVREHAVRGEPPHGLGDEPVLVGEEPVEVERIEGADLRARGGGGHGSEPSARRRTATRTIRVGGRPAARRSATPADRGSRIREREDDKKVEDCADALWWATRSGPFPQNAR